jgi:hypothetical protein
MKRITITQEYDVLLPAEYENITPEELVNDLNRMYDIHGRNIIQAMNAELDYLCTQLTHIDDTRVYYEDEGGEKTVSDTGYDIVLDGQQFNNNHP